MTLDIGTKVGRFEIRSKIGAGGMGEVYRARDEKLNRDVAIKVLPTTLSENEDRLRRFEQEAQAAGALNHPNILAVYDVGTYEASPYIVAELLEGQSLKERLADGPIPQRKAIEYTLQIAHGLAAAHDKGIIHRDLKPDNLFVTHDDRVKILDFGIAKLTAPNEGSAAQTDVATRKVQTDPGSVIGTVGYMSPEQVRGKQVDFRSDIFSLGAVFYEMLSGQRAFRGDSAVETLNAILKEDPPELVTINHNISPTLERLVWHCLEKSPERRFQSATDVAFAMESLSGFSSKSSQETLLALGPDVSKRVLTRERISWVLLCFLLAVGMLLVGRYLLAPTPAVAQPFEFDIIAPGTTIESGSFSISPDGTRVALVIREESGERKLATRDMNSTGLRILPGTNGALYPFWSPDGRELGFFSGNQLNRVSLDGAAARFIANVIDPRGGTWGAGDIILIGSAAGPIQRVSASGGKRPEPITELEKSVEQSHDWPAFLPDGKRFVFLADSSSDEGHRIRLGSLDGGPTTILKKGVRSQPIVDPKGRLLLGERNQLLAYPFDLSRGTLGEEASLISAPVLTMGNEHHLPASASHGMVAFQVESSENNRVVLDNAGRIMRTVGAPDRYSNLSISPNGKRVAFELFGDSSERLIWVEDLDRGVRTPVSQHGKLADSAAWSPDSETVYFDSSASGNWEIYRKVVTGGGEPQSLGFPEGSHDIAVLDVSSDGRWLLINSANGENRYDLYLRSLDSNGGWKAWVSTPASEAAGSFSPDSHWIAYTSDDSGRVEIYVAPVEGGPAVQRWQISSEGGFEPRFSRDGKTIYYRSAAFDWTAVDVQLNPGKVVAGTSKKLFSISPIELPYLRNLMTMLPDGSGFMTLRPPSTSTMSIRVRTGK